MHLVSLNAWITKWFLPYTARTNLSFLHSMKEKKKKKRKKKEREREGKKKRRGKRKLCKGGKPDFFRGLWMEEKSLGFFLVPCLFWNGKSALCRFFSGPAKILPFWWFFYRPGKIEIVSSYLEKLGKYECDYFPFSLERKENIRI